MLVDGVLALRQGSWDHGLAPSERVDPAGADGANTGRASFRNLFGGPMLGATTRLGQLALGGALLVPFGGRSHWDKNPRFADSAFPLAADGVQRWHNIDGAITVAYLTLGAAYRLGPLAFGATANLIRTSIEQVQAKNILGNGEPDTTREGRADLAVGGWHGSFGLGVMWEVVPARLWLGASYQAQPGLGEMALSGTLITRYEGSTSTFNVTFRQALPDVIRWGARLRPLAQLELRAVRRRHALECAADPMCVTARHRLRGRPRRRRCHPRRQHRAERAPALARHLGAAGRDQLLAPAPPRALAGRRSRKSRAPRRHLGARFDGRRQLAGRARRPGRGVSQLVPRRHLYPAALLSRATTPAAASWPRPSCPPAARTAAAATSCRCRCCRPAWKSDSES